jgi:hypothetical protein
MKASLFQDVDKFPDRTSGCSRRSGLDRAARYFHNDGIVVQSVAVLSEAGGEIAQRVRYGITETAQPLDLIGADPKNGCH